MNAPTPVRKPVALLIEPDGRLRTALALILSRAGYACLAAASEVDGSDLLADRRCDVLVAHIPGARHPHAAWLRSLREGGRRVPIVVITESAGTFTSEVQAAFGITALVPTPIVPTRLVSALVNVCPLREGEEEGAGAPCPPGV